MTLAHAARLEEAAFNRLALQAECFPGTDCKLSAMIELAPRWLLGAALAALFLVVPASGGLSKEVTVTGRGATPQEAFDDAIRTALRQVAGSFVRTDSKVQDDQLIQDRIITHSQGFIEKATKEGPAKKLKDGTYEQVARVIVRVGKVQEIFTESAASSSTIDGDSLAAKVRSLRENKASADELLAAVFEGFPANVMDCEIAPECTGDRLMPSAPPEGGDRESGDFRADSLRGDDVFVLLKVDVWVNERKWKAWAKAAEDAFKAVAISQHTIKINAKKTGAKKLTMNMGLYEDDWITENRRWMSEACAKAEHLAWNNRGSTAWRDHIWSAFELNIVSQRAATGNTLKDGEVSLKDAGVIAIIPSMGATSFSSFALPRSALWGALRTDQFIELKLDLFNRDGDSFGTSVPIFVTIGAPGRITTKQRQIFSYNEFTGCPWWVREIGSTDCHGALLLPMFPALLQSDVILCSRLTIPVGVILTQEELASLTKVEARLSAFIPDQR